MVDIFLLAKENTFIMPDVLESSEETDLVATAAEDERYAELLLAGFRACAREALRFLLEEEGLSPDHPLPSGLNEYLVRQQCHLAETLHNDSGVDFEESFLTSASDGDATILNEFLHPEMCTNSRTVTQESDFLQTSSGGQNSEMTESSEHCLSDETESALRTEKHKQNQS